jgi:hypothetical protein
MSTESDLRKETKDWSLPLVVRNYDTDDKGSRRFHEEAAILGANGYSPSTQSEEGGHIHAGRLLMTGGLSIFAGRKGIRSKGKLTVTYSHTPAPVAANEPSPVEQLRALAELRDAGLVTPEEYEAKRADLVARL